MTYPQLGTEGGKSCRNVSPIPLLATTMRLLAGSLPHVARYRRRRRASAIIEHFAGHTQALALEDPSASAHGNTRSILSTLLRALASLQDNKQRSFVGEGGFAIEELTC